MDEGMCPLVGEKGVRIITAQNLLSTVCCHRWKYCWQAGLIASWEYHSIERAPYPFAVLISPWISVALLTAATVWSEYPTKLTGSDLLDSLLYYIHHRYMALTEILLPQDQHRLWHIPSYFYKDCSQKICFTCPELHALSSTIINKPNRDQGFLHTKAILLQDKSQNFHPVAV